MEEVEELVVELEVRNRECNHPGMAEEEVQVAWKEHPPPDWPGRRRGGGPWRIER